MGNLAIAQAPVSVRVEESASDNAHRYANYLKYLSPGTAERVINDQPICEPDSDAFARAVKNMGGILMAASRAGDACESILEVIFGGNTPAPWLCADMERACGGTVKVEEMRPDLVWFRDGAAEIIGFAQGMDHSKRELEQAIRDATAPPEMPVFQPGDSCEIIDRLGGTVAVARLFGIAAPSVSNWRINGIPKGRIYELMVMRPQAIAEGAEPEHLVDGKWDSASYRAGLLHGVPADEAERMLSDVYKDADWTKPATLDGLFEDANFVRSDSVYHQIYGMLWDFNDTTRAGLIDECGVNLSRDWSVQKTNELWEKAQLIRGIHPANSTIAAHAFAMGCASVIDDESQRKELIRFHGLAPSKDWTPQQLSDLAEHARAMVVNEAIQAEHESVPSWSDVLLGYSYGVRNLVDAEKAARMSRAALNLLDSIIPGIEAIHDFQWIALDAPNADSLDSRSPRNLAVFLKGMQELTQLLVNLNDNMDFRIRQLAGEIE